MKLISLNIWGGIVFEPLMAYLKEQSGSTDIFCFQEVFDTPTDKTLAREGARADLYRQLVQALPDFVGHFHSAQDHYEYGHLYYGDTPWDIFYGLASFVKKGISMADVGEYFVHKRKNDLASNGAKNVPRNVQYLRWTHKGVPYTVINFHGLWHPTIKKVDYPERIAQSEKLRALMDSFPGEKILCGDFNLNPDTQSIAILERGMRNLVKEHGITSTRSELYTKENKFADYILVTPGVTVQSFSVPSMAVSDHLPMILEFA